MLTLRVNPSLRCLARWGRGTSSGGVWGTNSLVVRRVSDIVGPSSVLTKLITRQIICLLLQLPVAVRSQRSRQALHPMSGDRGWRK